jgi:hypothetical protein
MLQIFQKSKTARFAPRRQISSRKKFHKQVIKNHQVMKKRLFQLCGSKLFFHSEKKKFRLEAFCLEFGLKRFDVFLRKGVEMKINVLST